MTKWLKEEKSQAGYSKTHQASFIYIKKINKFVKFLEILLCKYGEFLCPKVAKNTAQNQYSFNLSEIETRNK